MDKNKTSSGGSMNVESVLRDIRPSIGGSCSGDTIRTMFPEKGSYDNGRNTSEYNKK